MATSLRIDNANVSWAADNSLRSVDFADVYATTAGAIGQAEQVFLKGNGLPDRWRSLAPSQSFRIGELGFGTGVNFLVTWRAWRDCARPDCHLHYLAFERWPLRHADLSRALAHWPDLADLSRDLLAIYPDHSAGLHRLQLSDRVTLDLYFGDAAAGLAQRWRTDTNGIQAWYLDGFAPRQNPALWNESLMHAVAEHSAVDATAATYSVAGQVRRALEAAGFAVTRAPGYGPKRERLCAQRTPSIPRGPGAVPGVSSRDALVIGAGLAGCAAAHALARRGWQVTLLDSDQVAGGASGNQQAVLQLRLAADGSAISRFHLHAYLYATRHFQQLRAAGLVWHDCGVIRLERDPGDSTPGRYRDIYDPAVLEYQDRFQLSARAGIALDQPGYWLPQGGWLAPAALCALYCDSAMLEVRPHTPVRRLEWTGEVWRAWGDSGQLAQASTVVLANAHLARRFDVCEALPLTPVRGQVTLCTHNPEVDRLSCVINGGKYVCPASGGYVTVGSTYQHGDADPVPRDRDDHQNIQGIRDSLPGITSSAWDVADRRAAVRCASLDRAPLIGPVPRMAEGSVTEGGPGGEPPRWPGLFASLAHGSHGLTTAPLSGELLAAMINGEGLPVTRDCLSAVDPARFLVRAQRRANRRSRPLRSD